MSGEDNEVHLATGLERHDGPAPATCGIGPVASWTYVIQKTTCPECLYEVAYLVLERARMLVRE